MTKVRYVKHPATVGGGGKRQRRLYSHGLRIFPFDMTFSQSCSVLPFLATFWNSNVMKCVLRSFWMVTPSVSSECRQMWIGHTLDLNLNPIDETRETNWSTFSNRLVTSAIFSCPLYRVLVQFGRDEVQRE